MERLTKVVQKDGKECVTCIYNGTDKCRIHNFGNTYGCMNCPVMGAILNKLNAIEEILEENDK
jgi:hypothetical protein